MFRLIAARDDDFAWLLADGEPPRADLRIAPGGLDEDITVIHHVRAITQRLHANNETGSWMMSADDEVVGLCGFHAGPSAGGTVEIGYNVAPARRRRGYATLAIAAMIEHAHTDWRIRAIIAVTRVENAGSQRALQANAFVRSGAPAAAGEIAWQRDLVYE